MLDLSELIDMHHSKFNAYQLTVLNEHVNDTQPTYIEMNSIKRLLLYSTWKHRWNEHESCVNDVSCMWCQAHLACGA